MAHRLTKRNHLWTNDWIGWTNCTLRKAAVNRYHYETRPALNHLADFVTAYDFGKA